MISTSKKLKKFWAGGAVCALISVGLIGADRAQAQDSGSIVMWGLKRVVSQEDLSNLTAIGAGEYHSLGLKADGSIVCWGDAMDGQCDVPEPNADFVAIGTGQEVLYSVAVKADGSVVCWGPG
ncbi:MAG: hypothetical protein ACYTGD_16655, partial [Planctomycetota bacterium]